MLGSSVVVEGPTASFGASQYLRCGSREAVKVVVQGIQNGWLQYLICNFVCIRCSSTVVSCSVWHACRQRPAGNIPSQAHPSKRLVLPLSGLVQRDAVVGHVKANRNQAGNLKKHTRECASLPSSAPCLRQCSFTPPSWRIHLCSKLQALYRCRKSDVVPYED